MHGGLTSARAFWMPGVACPFKLPIPLPASHPVLAFPSAASKRATWGSAAIRHCRAGVISRLQCLGYPHQRHAAQVHRNVDRMVTI